MSSFCVHACFICDILFNISFKNYAKMPQNVVCKKQDEMHESH